MGLGVAYESPDLRQSVGQVMPVRINQISNNIARLSPEEDEVRTANLQSVQLVNDAKRLLRCPGLRYHATASDRLISLASTSGSQLLSVAKG